MGIVGGVLLVIFWRIGLFAAGGVGGFFGAMFLLALLPIFLEPIWRALIIVIAAIICAFLIFVFERPMIIIATALTGSFLTVLGIDYFARTQFASTMSVFLSSKGQYSPDARTYAMLAGVAVLFLLGLIVQFTFFKEVFVKRKHKHTKSEA